MSVLVFAESYGGKIKKAALEAIAYGSQTAKLLGTDCVALTIGAAEGADTLGQYGVSKVYSVAADGGFDSQVYASAINQAVDKLGATVVVFAHSASGKTLAGRVAAALNAGSATSVMTLPDVSGGGFKVRKGVFSGKGFATYELKSAVKVVTIAGNTFRPENTGGSASVEALAVSLPAARIRVKNVATVEGQTPLPEAEKVVSAGRGMKGPENWGMVEELAKELGAATACSRPVADVHWRPHHEHVGQTGVAIRPTLYIAIGISGAIQHLAGVNQSKVIVVINKDPEAPFFKAADYGVVGDLFEVVPRLIEAVKKFKSAGN